MATQETRWKTVDGVYYTSQEDAETHEAVRKTSIAMWLSSNLTNQIAAEDRGAAAQIIYENFFDFLSAVENDD